MSGGASPIRASVLLAALGLGGGASCSQHPLEAVELDIVQQAHDHGHWIRETDDLDILFVIDDAASMGEEQAALARSIDAFLEVLERPEVDLDYRIAITTTDNGNPWCESTPAAGRYLAASCRSHLDDFRLDDGTQRVEVAHEACTTLCPSRWAEIETLPSAAQWGSEPRPQPWIERLDGATNLPSGLDTAQAFRCLAPQGITGCGFGSPLESMWKALRRPDFETEAEHGFLRDDAALLVVFLTDGVDCSYAADAETIFLPDGERTFWSSPEAEIATGAVCWNAGVACNQLPDGTRGCHAVDLDLQGTHVAEEDADALAVLRPVSRYTELLDDIERRKQGLGGDQPVVVAVLGGVTEEGELLYPAAADPWLEAEHGSGPGCTGASGMALPPVRLSEVAQAFPLADGPALYSSCGGDYGPALADLAERLVAQRKALCLPMCVADAEPATLALEPDCVVTQELPDPEGRFYEVEVPQCEPGRRIPEGHDLCWIPRTAEALALDCEARGFNVEAQIVRRPASPQAASAGLRFDCELDPQLCYRHDC